MAIAESPMQANTSLSIPTGLHAQFANPVYVETGIWEGGSLQLAQSCGAFERVIGIDQNALACERAQANVPAADIRCGKSEETLAQVLKEITTPATFFLDAHGYGPGESRDKDQGVAVGAELTFLSLWWIPGSVIIIDDLHMFGQITHPWGKHCSRYQLAHYLVPFIANGCQITYFDSKLAPNAILVLRHPAVSPALVTPALQPVLP
jgi:hypothetical protein